MRALQSLKRSWYNRPWFWVVELGFFLSVATVFWVFATPIFGVYEWAWLHIPGKPWTYVMREYPVLLVIPVVLILGSLVGMYFAITAPRLWNDVRQHLGPRKQLLLHFQHMVLTRLLFLLVIAIGLGFVSGHVFWGGSLRESKGVYNDLEVKFYLLHVSADTDVGEELHDWLHNQVIPVRGFVKGSVGPVGKLYVFGNGDGRKGSLGYQPDILDTVPGNPGYSQLREVYRVQWVRRGDKTVLSQIEELRAAEARGEITISETGTVVNAPVHRWGR